MATAALYDENTSFSAQDSQIHYCGPLLQNDPRKVDQVQQVIPGLTFSMQNSFG